MNWRIWLIFCAVLAALKLAGVVRASWWLVTSPLWVPPALVVAAIAAALLGSVALALMFGGDG